MLDLHVVSICIHDQIFFAHMEITWIMDRRMPPSMASPQWGHLQRRDLPQPDRPTYLSPFWYGKGVAWYEEIGYGNHREFKIYGKYGKNM